MAKQRKEKKPNKASKKRNSSGSSTKLRALNEAEIGSQLGQVSPWVYDSDDDCHFITL